MKNHTTRRDVFDIAPFALPATGSNVRRFEEPRDIECVRVTFAGRAPARVRLSYLRKTWPRIRYERVEDCDTLVPARFGWIGIDDWFNAQWQAGAIRARRVDARTVEIRFRGIREELDDVPGDKDFNVTYRRTLGVRVEAGTAAVSGIKVFTRSPRVVTSIRVELDAGRKTSAKAIRLSGYNARVRKVHAGQGVRVDGHEVRPGRAKRRLFRADVEHMVPAFRYANDDGHVSFDLGNDMFTISLASLEREGPIWFAETGVFVTRADDETTADEYRRCHRGGTTVSEDVAARGEQSLLGALDAQPRSHPLPYVFGYRLCREMFILESNGDLTLAIWPIVEIAGRDAPRYANRSAGRFFFGLEKWITLGRHHAPYPRMSQTLQMREGTVTLDLQAFALPLMENPLVREPEPDGLLTAMLRFRFRNIGSSPSEVRLPVQYMDRSAKGPYSRCCDPDPLTIRSGWIRTQYKRRQVLRACCDTSMRTVRRGTARSEFVQTLAPGEECELVLKVPYVELDTPAEKKCLRELDFKTGYHRMIKVWEREPLGATLTTPEPRLDELHTGHVPTVQMADFGVPDGSGMVNTSVGAACYINYPNESCMIIQDLDERGLRDDVRKRLAVWLKYQGTKGLMGNFTDHDGVFYGAGGAEQGESYNQHHGWVLWAIAEHYFLTRDRAWLKSVADGLVRGLEWVERQRKETRKPLPHSRGWERGFLPAGALEDVDDYLYWLSTNALTWRGVDTAARALAEIGHPEAKRFQKEADAYRRDLVRGFEISRRHTPLVRLRNGRWIPHYSSRLYCRGRDVGWIRETLEGSVYLLISGLYDPRSREAKWILDDFQDNRYMNPPYGFPVIIHTPVPPGFLEERPDRVTDWYHQGGYSVQPNLLAGLLPHLDRDEIEVYLWMFFNAYAACYCEEIGSLFEHPIPTLGFANIAPAKTSDQSNAMKWLRYMFVYAPRNELLIGRAVPRAWFAADEPMGLDGVATRFGKITVQYGGDPGKGLFTARLDLRLRTVPDRIVVRFRTPDKAPLRKVTVNGKRHRAFDPAKGDVDITGMRGRVRIEAVV